MALDTLHLQAKFTFMLHQFRCQEEADVRCGDIRNRLGQQKELIASLEKVRPDAESEGLLKPLLGFIRDLLRAMMPLETVLDHLSNAKNFPEIMKTVELLQNMATKGV